MAVAKAPRHRRHNLQHRDSLDRPDNRASKGRPEHRDKRVIQGKRVMQDIGVIGDIRAIQDKRATGDIPGIQDKRVTPAIEARPHHARPDSILIPTPIQERWIA